ncbi:villin-like protein quail [Chironomus tepperi]|uniref:villin-like protein quail n=1 Tax=Chironomus tepperi TaxID=113505 RepID=UPI00391F1D5B
MKVLDISQKDCDLKRPIYEEIRVDPLFRKISKHSIGFHIFKVENDHIESVGKDQIGVFYDENVYIIYAAAIKGTFTDQNTISREIKTSVTIERFVHIWIGSSASTVKSKNAALKIIELDVHFNHSVVQYRESQGHETKRFLSYFKENGMQILTGTSHKSTPEYPRLYQIYGKTCPICIQMKSINWIDNFNSGNVMILQTQCFIFVWVGRSSSSIERVNSLKIASKFRDCRPSTEIAVVDDGYEQSMSIECKTEWNKFLNLSERLVHPLVIKPVTEHNPLKLYKCANLNGLFRAEHIKTDGIEQIDLNDKNSTFIIDGDVYGIWIWIGRNVPKGDKAEGMRHVRGYMIKRNHPSTHPVIRIIDGHEPIEFIAMFPQWIDNDHSTSIARHVLEKFDALTLIQRPQVAAQMQLIDDGCGEIKVFRIDSDDITDIPKKYGQVFYSNNCYIIHYQTHAASTSHSVKNVIYLWIGSQAKQMDKTTGELFLTEMFDHFNTNVVQIRVHEGMEPPHFLQLFRGRLIILHGYDPCGAKRKFPPTFILKVIGNSTYTTKAIQMTNKSSHQSTDCYIIKTISGTIYVWCSQSSTGDTREMAKGIAGMIGEPQVVMEGAENEEFYESVGDKFVAQVKVISNNYMEPTLYSTWEKSKVSLYLATLIQSQIQLEQIFAFEQKDLTPDNIYLLDAGSMIYIWLGSLSDVEQRNAVWIMGLHLISIHPIPRSLKVPVCIIKQGYEPISFTGFFDKWDPKLLDNIKTFEKLRIQMNLSGTHPIPSPRSITNSISDVSYLNEFDKHQKYPLEMLRGDPLNLPTYINPSQKEIHLTHDDFVSVFNMEYTQFAELPKWKQVELKKQYKLF